MDNFKRNYLRRTLSLLLAVIMIITLVPLGSFTALAAPAPDALSSATYYRKANWENKIKDKSRWPIGENQRLVRVTTSEPLKMNDVNYDGAFIDANGRTVLRLIYRERAAATSGVWYRALFNFGDLDQYIDYDKSYVVGRDGETKYDLKPFNDRKERLLDIGLATGDRTNQRKNLPINLVLKEGLRTKDLGDRNYLVQMRITNDDNATKIYAYAPGKSSMDYSSYTKTTSVSLSDKVDSLFVKGGQQSDSENATNQEFFMSEYIANPDDYADTTNIGIIRTQYMGQRKGTEASPTVGGEPIAFVQVFDAKLVPFLKEIDSDRTIAYTNLLNVDRTVSKYANKVKIKKTDINYSKDGKLAYVVLAPKAFQKDGVNKVEISKHDQYTMLQGFYFTAIDYLVDKTKFADNFSGTNKLDYSMMSGWMNPNLKGWTVFEKVYDHNFKVPEGESYLIDVGTKPASNQIMIQIGDETRALYRKPQGYYNGYVTGKNGIDQIDEFAKGVYEFTLREGATIEAGQKIRILVPYVGDHPNTVNFLEASDGTEYNKGSAQLRLQKDRNINMHLYTDLPRGASFKLRYTLKGETEEKSLDFTTPKAGTFWQYTDSDKVLTGLPNRSILSSGGNFWINTKQLEPGKDIIVDAYDEKGNKIEGKTSSFRYSNIMKVSKHTDMTWVDHSDTSSILSINKSLYTPYQLLFTNDYVDGTDDFYKDPRAFTGTNEDFMKDTTSFVGYTKYDGGKVRTLYEEGKVGKLYAKVEAAEDEYNDKGELTTNNSKKITIPKSNIFDAQFDGDNKEYTAYEYKVDLTKMLPYHSNDKTPTPLTLLKDMKFVSTASDGSSLPSDLYETRVRARVLFDTTDGKFADNTKKAVKIVPDNVKFYGEDGYAANGFEGANVEPNTGDKFPEAPKLEGKNFLGWVTEKGKTALGKNVVTADEFNALPKDQIFTNETPITKHLVVYAIYSEDVAVTFDANQGKFADGKDTTNVKVEGGKVTAPTPEQREGFTFKGWADKKDATTANVTDFTNITAPKTYYAVWEKKADAELTLKNPDKTPVGDLTSLTSGEKDAVIAAIIKANKDAGLTAADIKVGNDGTAIVSKDGKTKEFKPADTVEQKEVQNNFNPPKEPVLVENTSGLTTEEKDEVKKAVIKANPDRNLKDEDITVDNDGKVTINQNGKTGEIPADKTVKAKDSVLTLADPDFTEVKDINNLTEDEKDAVKKAVIAKNKGLTEKDITVDSKGNVSVKTGDGKTGEIPAAKTVKEKDLSKLKNPAVTPVANDKNLTENEKQAVKDAIKAANKDYDLQDNEITVDETGKATVTRGKSSKEFAPAETVKKDAKLLDVKAPKKTEVANINDLTEPEQEAVEQAIIDANPDLNLTKEEVVINDDGSAVITRGDKKYALAQADTVVEKLKYPEITEVADPAKLTENEKADVENAVRKANPNLPADTKIVVAANGEVTVTYPESDGRPVATIPAKNTVVKANTKDTTAPAAPTVEAKDDGSVTVTPPNDVDVKSMDITYTPEGSDTPVTVKATKDDYGNWSLPDGSDLKIEQASGVVTIPADKVKDKTEVSAKAKDGSNNESTAGKDKAKTPADTTAPKAPTVVAENNGDVKVTPPTDETVKTIDVTYTPEGKTEPVTVTATKGEDGKWTVPAESGLTVDKEGNIVVPADKVADNTEVKAVAKDAKNTPSKETETSKANAKKPAEEQAPKAPTVVAENNGDVKVTPPTDETVKTIDVTYTPEGKTEPVTVTATKGEDGKWTVPAESGLTVDKEGNIVVPADKVADNTEVKAVAKDAKNTPSKETETSKANAKKPAEEQAPKAPTVVAENNGDVKVTPPTDETVKTIDVTYTPEGKTEPVTVTATKGEDGKWTVPAESGLTVDKEGNIVVPADKVADNTEVKAVAKDAKNTPSKETETSKANAKKPAEEQAPKAPTVVAENNGDVKVTPPTDETVKTIDVTYTPEGKTEPVTVTATKGEDGKWTVPAESGLTVDKEGNIVVPADKVADNTEVKAVAKDAKNTPSKETETSKANAKKPAEEQAPKAPTVVAENNGDVKVTPPTDETVKTIDVTYTPEGKTEPVTVTATKGEDGKWTVPAESGLTVDKEGNIVVPADKVADNTEVKAVAKDAKNTPSKETETSKANAKKPAEEQAPKAPTVVAENNGDVKVTPPTDETVKTIDVTYTPEGKTEPVTVTATKGEDGKWTVPAESGLTVDKEGNIVVPADKVADNTEVKAVAKDAKNTPSKETETSKANAKTPSTTPTTKINDPTAKVTVDNSKLLSDDDKEKVKKAVEEANKDSQGNSTLPEGSTIDVADDGTVTVKDKTGKEIAKIKPDKTVEQDGTKLPVKPAEPIPVENPDHLTDAEKAAIKKAIKEANRPTLDDANIEVADDGTVTVTKDDKSTTIPANRTRKAMPRPDYADIYYPDTTIGVGDERRIYPSGYPGYVSTLPGDIDAPRGVYVRVNHDGSIDVEVSPRYTGPSMFTITGYVDLDGKIAPISIRIRVIDDVRSDRRRQRMDKRDEMDKEDELIDTREVLTHKAYIFGYPDGTVRPNGFITRAEAAAMLSRLLNEENTSSAAKPAFIDTPSKWYNNAINAVVARGIMRGYSDGRFKPNAPITRAEFAQMISAIDAKPFGTAPFNDVKGHWAELAIGKEYAAGRISGYPNGTFRPDAPITRAEAAHILNKIFERNYDLVSALQSNDKGNIKFFTDLSTSFWGYNDMIEATNTHTFRRRVKGMVQEDWDNINR
ncbi:hypothetical protein C3V37_05770 [Peptostreptococcaceae bacterium oral taxon 929]|nr:hypothetical protein C3V37_05770 [Peptostreptococcaceae bacterium oral taxon 929]